MVLRSAVKLCCSRTYGSTPAVSSTELVDTQFVQAVSVVRCMSVFGECVCAPAARMDASVCMATLSQRNTPTYLFPGFRRVGCSHRHARSKVSPGDTCWLQGKTYLKYNVLADYPRGMAYYSTMAYSVSWRGTQTRLKATEDRSGMHLLLSRRALAFRQNIQTTWK